MENKELDILGETKVTVCSSCLKASCWNYIFLCEDYQIAGTIEKTVKELYQLNKEHPDYFDPSTARPKQ